MSLISRGVKTFLGLRSLTVKLHQSWSLRIRATKIGNEVSRDHWLKVTPFKESLRKRDTWLKICLILSTVYRILITQFYLYYTVTYGHLYHYWKIPCAVVVLYYHKGVPVEPLCSASC